MDKKILETLQRIADTPDDRVFNLNMAVHMRKIARQALQIDQVKPDPKQIELPFD